jgi:hypothetical protein
LQNVAREPNIILRPWRDLRFILIKIKRGIELRLIVGESFLQTRAALLFLLRELVERA